MKTIAEKQAFSKWFADSTSWFALYVRTNFERHIAERLNVHLGSDKYIAFVPTKEYAFRKHGLYTVQKVTLMKGYVFIASTAFPRECLDEVKLIIDYEPHIYIILANDEEPANIAFSKHDKLIMTTLLDEEFNVPAFDAFKLGDSVIVDAKVIQSETPYMPITIGKYTVTFENQGGVARRSYSLLTAFEAREVEREDNNTIETATRITTNNEMIGNLSGKNDLDWHSFTLNTLGIGQVLLNLPEGGSARTYFTVDIADETGKKVINTILLTGNKTEIMLGDLYLGAGTYLLQFTAGSSWTDTLYRFTVDFEQKGGMEQEPNNMFDDATSLGLGESIEGIFTHKSDVDSYRIELPHDGILQLGLSFTPLEDSKKTYTVTLSDGATTFFQKDVGGKETDAVIPAICLSAGTCFVRIEDPNWVRQAYKLSTAFTQANSIEYEPNNTLEDAALLKAGVKRTGSLTSADDVDIYQLNIAADTTINFAFEFTPAQSTDTYFILETEANGRILWSNNVTGSSGGIKTPMQIPAVIYYLRVKSSCGTQMFTRLNMTSKKSAAYALIMRRRISMKRVFSVFVMLVLLVGAGFASAADLGVQIILPKDEPDELANGTLEDMELNISVDVPDFGTITLTYFNFSDTIAYDNGAWGDNYSYSGTLGSFTSGNEADYVCLGLDILNTTLTSIEYLNDVSVTVVYRDNYELRGFSYQKNFDLSNAGYRVKTKSRSIINPFYVGHYLFGCTVPNAIVNDWESTLKMVIAIGEVEFAYYIRR